MILRIIFFKTLCHLLNIPLEYMLKKGFLGAGAGTAYSPSSNDQHTAHTRASGLKLQFL